ncbi:transcriptional regulator [Terrihabitans soli]|uniref:Transcriptional regulator n=1 Tax=Terrihabitans soli TaxID=708113 RepID=A0A6S6QUJ6_9HYPH|nr:acetamidase/formamidase family protein [Terrihabitans soli]BCJ91235.1 transcriptional regulator [Terrihabitans soli]
MSAGPTVISIDAFPLAGQRDAWAEALASVGLASRVPEGMLLAGDIGIMRSPSGAMLARMRSSPQQIANAGLRKSGDPLVVMFHTDGRGELRGGALTREFAEGDVSIADRAQNFTLDLREDFEILMLEIPRDRLLGRLGRTRIQLPAVLGATVAAAAVRPVMRTLVLHFEQIGDADLASAEIAVTELIAGALLGEARLEDEGGTQTQTAHFRRVTAAIEVRLVDPGLSMAAIAAQEALSQRYIQKLFELQDTTFSDYVRQRRLDRSRLDLSDPRHAADGIAEIAFRWGFRDPAHFSRVFSAAYGTSPRAFRNAAERLPKIYPQRGRPIEKSLPHNTVVGTSQPGPAARVREIRERAGAAEPSRHPRHQIRVNKDNVHWGYLSRSIPPVLRVSSGSEVVIETLTQHAFDDYERMIKGDAGAESVFHWTAEGKNVERRGAGPMNASILGRGAGEGFGVHIFTGPVFIKEAEPGDILEVQILDIAPRPSANPDYAGRCFASNASAWWGYQYSDLLAEPKKRETVTIYEMDPDGAFARAVYSYRWTPQVDPFGVRHDTMDYPGVPVDHTSVEELHGIMQNVRVPLRPHFGCMAVAPRESDLIDSIPPGYFGGNIDNWRAAKGTTLYLPVAVPGALFSVGDGHFAQGDGEINGTGLEASLTGTFRFTVHKKDGQMKPHLRGLSAPLLETPQEYVLHGFSYPNYLRELGRNAQSEVYKKSSLSKALRSAFRGTRRFLMDTWGLSEDQAISLISVGVDFGITQVADGNWGVHAVIRKSMFQ